MEKRAQNIDVYSVRQLGDPFLPIAPKFAGLVIGQVKTSLTAAAYISANGRRVNLGQSSKKALT